MMQSSGAKQNIKIRNNFSSPAKVDADFCKLFDDRFIQVESCERFFLSPAVDFGNEFVRVKITPAANSSKGFLTSCLVGLGTAFSHCKTGLNITTTLSSRLSSRGFLGRFHFFY